MAVLISCRPVSGNRSTSSGERYEGDVTLPAVGAGRGSADKIRPLVTADLLQSVVFILFVKPADGHRVEHADQMTPLCAFDSVFIVK